MYWLIIQELGTKSNNMKNFLISWKTTSAGILTIIGGIVTLVYALKAGNVQPEAITTAAAAILGGIGLIAAKDGNVTGGNIQQ